MNELTTEDIVRNWVYVCNTPAHGKHYHDEKTDRAAIVYINKTKVFSNRKEGFEGNYASCYEDVNLINQDKG